MIPKESTFPIGNISETYTSVILVIVIAYSYFAQKPGEGVCFIGEYRIGFSLVLYRSLAHFEKWNDNSCLQVRLICVTGTAAKLFITVDYCIHWLVAQFALTSMKLCVCIYMSPNAKIQTILQFLHLICWHARAEYWAWEREHNNYNSRKYIEEVKSMDINNSFEWS